MRSSTVCMRAAVTPIKLRITSKMSATNSTTPDWREREFSEWLRCFIFAPGSTRCIPHADRDLKDLTCARVARRGDGVAQQVVGGRNGRNTHRTRLARGQYGNLYADAGIEVNHLIGRQVFRDRLRAVGVDAVEHLHGLDVRHQLRG